LQSSTQSRQTILTLRKQRAERWIAIFQKAETRFPWLRLAIFLIGIVSIFTAFQLLDFLWAWLVVLLALGVFVFAALKHNQLVEKIKRLDEFSQLLARQIARIELDWEHIPAASGIVVPPEHPFASDLNLTGPRSLHQLLDTSVSTGGSSKLADWLLQTNPTFASVVQRQALVQELLPRASFRTQLELYGTLANPEQGKRWNTASVSRWLEKNTRAASLRPYLIALSLLALSNLLLYLLNALGLLPPLWVGTVVIYLGMQSLKFRESSEVFDEAYTLGKQLGQLRMVLSELELYPYTQGSLLAGVAQPFTQGATRPSIALRRVSRIITAAGLRNNPFLGLILNLLMPWDFFFAYQLERLKNDLRDCLPGWLGAWYELEALTSFANDAALHPENVFPEIQQEGKNGILELVDVGHPLIPLDNRITNTYSIRRSGEIALITGSNMSGMSTFLRTIGINLVMAFAGSTVPAHKMTCIPVRLYTSMTLNDSLNDGISFFYAEVRRLKALLDALDARTPLPLLFLIDEIFRGTNNRERQIGSQAYTRALAGRHGAGFLATHDLELANLATENEFIKNFHFRETVQDGQMVFDYQIHPGASPTTNALRIMALAGLPLPPAYNEPVKNA
jgi:hypothetical protein